MNKKLAKITAGVLIVAVLIVAVYNMVCNDKFFEASFTSCISLIVAIGLTFYFVQVQTDRRKQKEIFIQLIESFKCIVDDEKSSEFEKLSDEEILMLKRNMSNKLEIIKKLEERFSIEEQVAFLAEKYEEYAAIIGNHIQDRDTLNKLHKELRRPLSLMSEKMFEMMLDLYK